MGKHLYILMLLTALLCASCVETIYPESVEEAPVVVNCVLDTSDTQSLYLAYSSKVSEVEDFKIIDNADAVLREIKGNDTVTVATFSFESDGMWRTNFRPVGGKEYQLLIEVPGQKRVTAITQMPEIITIYHGIGSSSSIGEISRYPGSSYWSFFANTTLYLSMFGKDNEGNIVIADEIATDHLFGDQFNVTGKTFTDLSKLPILYTTVEGKPLHKQYIRIPNPDKYINPNYNSGKEEYKGQFTVATNEKSIRNLTILQVSDELDAYYKDVLTYQNKYEVMDNLLIVYDRANVYNNVTNAIGIFGAYNKYILPWAPLP